MIINSVPCITKNSKIDSVFQPAGVKVSEGFVSYGLRIMNACTLYIVHVIM